MHWNLRSPQSPREPRSQRAEIRVSTSGFAPEIQAMRAGADPDMAIRLQSAAVGGRRQSTTRCGSRWQVNDSRRLGTCRS